MYHVTIYFKTYQSFRQLTTCMDGCFDLNSIFIDYRYVSFFRTFFAFTIADDGKTVSNNIPW